MSGHEKREHCKNKSTTFPAGNPNRRLPHLSTLLETSLKLHLRRPLRLKAQPASRPDRKRKRSKMREDNALKANLAYILTIIDNM